MVTVTIYSVAKAEGTFLVGTLPEGYRPPRRMLFNAYIGEKCVPGDVNTDGNVNLFTSATGNASGTVSFVV